MLDLFVQATQPATSFDVEAIVLGSANVIGLGLIAWLVKHWQTKTFPEMAADHRGQIETVVAGQKEATRLLIEQFGGEIMHQRNARAGEVERFLQEMKEERESRRATDASMQQVLRELTKEIHSLPERLSKQSIP